MKRGFLSVLCLVLAVCPATFNCMKGPTPTETDNDRQAGELLPLNVGNNWRYLYFALDEEGDTTLSEEHLWRVTGEKLVQGLLTYHMKLDHDLPGFATRREDGLFLLGYWSADEAFFDELFFKWPIQPGDSYDYVNSNGDTLRIAVTTETVTAPAGDFECLLYLLPDGREYRFAVDTGIVRIDVPSRSMILIEYNLE